MPRLPELDEVVKEDDGDAGDELVLDEDEEVDDDVVGGTRGSTWGATLVADKGGATRLSGSGAGGAAAVMLEIGEEDPTT